ncbi:MAG: pyridoxal-5'-phosphate-dependent protein subunit beta, partial [Actinomycetota bacterium]
MTSPARNAATHETHALDEKVLAAQLGLAKTVVDEASLANSVARVAAHKLGHPTSAQRPDPSLSPPSVTTGDDTPAADPRNLFRVHWYNDLAGNRVEVPDHVVLPPSLTGIESPIIVVFGDRFPMITAHKVLAAFACLAPRIITGQFDPTQHRAIWPSTGNYARGGVAIS